SIFDDDFQQQHTRPKSYGGENSIHDEFFVKPKIFVPTHPKHNDSAITIDPSYDLSTPLTPQSLNFYQSDFDINNELPTMKKSSSSPILLQDNIRPTLDSSSGENINNYEPVVDEVPLLEGL